MSKTKSTDELHSHKKQALQNVEDYLNKLIASEDSHDNGKADKLCYWLKDWMTFLDFEKSFSPMSLRRYKRGEPKEKSNYLTASLSIKPDAKSVL